MGWVGHSWSEPGSGEARQLLAGVSGTLPRGNPRRSSSEDLVTRTENALDVCVVMRQHDNMSRGLIWGIRSIDSLSY